MTTTTNIEAVAMSDEQIHEIASSYMEATGDVYVSFLPSNLDKFARALLASKPAVPEGWKLVPLEPTEKMIDAAQRYTWLAEEDATESGIWRHMLAAAPPALASPSGEDAAEEAAAPMAVTAAPMTNGDFHCPACGEVMKGPTACGSCLWEADTCGYPRASEQADEAVTELQNIVNAKRFDRDTFANDTEFADWVQSRARHTLGRAKEPK